MAKPKLRTPDGKIEMRSIDEMLAFVASDKEIANLPGIGKPLNLEAYFKPGEEFRVAGKILKENSVLPPHLQERKDAEDMQAKAELIYVEALRDIPSLRQDLLTQIEVLTGTFPSRSLCQEQLGFQDWPQDLSEPPGETTSLPSAEHVQNLLKEIARYNARVRNVIYRYLDCLQKAQQNIANFHKRQLLTTSLTPTYHHVPDIDLEQAKTQIEQTFSLLPTFPDDLYKRLKKWHRQTTPPVWKRLLRRSTP